MNFKKVIDGVIGFSNFLFGSLIWLGFSAISVWPLFGPRIINSIRLFENTLKEIFESDTHKFLIETFGVKPLVTPLTFFGVIFILYNHDKLLRIIGNFIPPDIILDATPGLRDIEPRRWGFILRELSPTYTIQEVSGVIKSRHDQATKDRYKNISLNTFKKIKTLMLLNFLLLIYCIAIKTENMPNFVLMATFGILGAITVLLQTYHIRNQSRWAIEKICEELILKNSERTAPLEERDKRPPLENAELSKRIDEYWRSLNERPFIHLGWSLPFLGSLAIWIEMRNRRRRVEEKLHKRRD